MNILALGIAICLSIFIGLFWLHHNAYNRNLSSTVVKTNNTVTKDVSKTVNIESDEFNGLASASYPVGMSVIVLIFSISIYASGGHFQGWDQGKVDSNVDYLVAADITKGRMQVEQQPQDEMALMALAQSYAEGGLYADSVDTLTQLISLVGNDAELLGMKATSMYYRDARTFGSETKQVIDTALSIQSDELHTRMLLATDAYLKGEFAIAIGHWRALLTNQSQPFNRQSITNAIIKAEFQLDEINR
ncbi:tetratricopeptide repeat protein [Shewanella donghaensis]|uniref:tetratricopeptide repeat protein n=1 Tax=Shewanella donghaensis TaxID=238836 RepID=UPI001181D6CC|nr:nitrite reductase [Shewanella donghaensis]